MQNVLNLLPIPFNTAKLAAERINLSIYLGYLMNYTNLKENDPMITLAENGRYHA